MSLSRKTPMHRHSRPVEDRVDPADAVYVFERDKGCVAAQTDQGHSCQGQLTIEHVPERGGNALGVRAISDRRHMLSLCLGAQSEYWGERNREVERAWIERLEP